MLEVPSIRVHWPVAVVCTAGPDAVSYLLEDGTPIFRMGPGTKMDVLLGGGRVALEAGGLNPYGTPSGDHHEIYLSAP